MRTTSLLALFATGAVLAAVPATASAATTFCVGAHPDCPAGTAPVAL
jgi:hypothetical protein